MECTGKLYKSRIVCDCKTNKKKVVILEKIITI